MDALRAHGHVPIGLTRANGDVADHVTWTTLPDTDCVVHLAGRSFVPDSWREPDEFIRTNVMGTTRALEYCRRRGATMVFLSSYMYGVPKELPIPESAPIVARNPYALSKQLAEETCRYFAAAFGLGTTVLRPFNIYGPGQREPFLIPHVIRQMQDGTVIRVKDLRPRRDYVYVADVVDGILRSLDGGSGYRVLNLGSGHSCSVAELIAELQRVAGTTLPVVSDEAPRAEEVMDTVADVRAAERQLGWRPHTPLADGLAATLEAAHQAVR